MNDETIGYIFLAVVLIGVSGFLYLDNYDAEDETYERWTGPLEPLPALEDLELDMDKVVLGRRLYHDGILSGDGSVSCASCHAINAGGAEPRRTSFGVQNAVGPINAPTTINAWNNVAQFWDGRAADLQEQAGGPVENPGEMAATFDAVIPRIEDDSWYTEHFASVYGADAVNKENITDAIAEYERSLITPGPFDAWLAGDDEAMSEEAVAGYHLFTDIGCTSCHSGPAIGGTQFHKMGLVHDYFEQRGGPITEADLGRFNHTGEESDRHFFKVPTLRNIALTGPYFHDGAEDDLGGAVRTMAHVQLGRDLEDEEVTQIVAYLETLTGELPEHALLPEAETPPERAYEMPLAYDIRLAKRRVNGESSIFLTGAVPTEEMKEALIARVTAKVGAVDATGLTVNPDATFTAPEGFDVAVDKVLEAFAPLSQGNADFDLTPVDGGAPKMCFVGEGSIEAMAQASELMSQVPDGFAWSKPVEIYDEDQVRVCDEALAAIQAHTRLQFATGSARLSEDSRTMLSRVPMLLDACPADLRLLIGGHTDNVGNDGMNLGLSRRRSAAVVDTLVRAGVEPARMISIGYGENKPMADNSTDEGRLQNRRIEMRLYREY